VINGTAVFSDSKYTASVYLDISRSSFWLRDQP